jgi:hypothetical protein
VLSWRRASQAMLHDIERRKRDRQLETPPGFFVTDDGKWTVVQKGMNGDKKNARRYHRQSENLKNFVEEPHSAIDGPAHGMAASEIIPEAAI